jgi:hypothetical protein
MQHLLIHNTHIISKQLIMLIKEEVIGILPLMNLQQPEGTLIC